MKATKIKTISRSWTRMLRAIDSPGPEVEFNPDDVTSVEYCGERSAPEADRTYYLYRRPGLTTLTVPHSELVRFQVLLKNGMDSYKRKINAPDPDHGSPS